MVDVDPIPAGSRILDEDLAAWRTVINGKLDGEAAYKTADTSRNNAGVGTTYTDDPHLTVTVAASGVYAVTFYCTLTAGATPQLKTRFALPSGTFYAGGFLFGASSAASYGATNANGEVVGLTGTAIPFQVQGTLIVGATGGDFKVQWAQVVANASNSTLHQGSYLLLLRMA